jgi:cobalt/nickel transport system ATP-binding protein
LVVKALVEALEMDDVQYAYPNGRMTLRGISLKVRAGERVAVVGPNGAGKSTLVMVAAGLFKPQRGSVRLFGVESFSEGFRSIRRRIGVVFQDPDDQLFCPSIWEDVIFGLTNIGLGKEEIVMRGKKALADVGLMGYEAREPYRLSIGEKKKAAIATALALDPEILILDEPTANLEPSAKKELVELLSKLHVEREMTIMASTHDIDMVPYIADRAYILDKGNILAEGGITEIFSNIRLLEACRLEPPTVAKLFSLLNDKFDLGFNSLPMTIDEALERIGELFQKRTMTSGTEQANNKCGA